LHQKLSTFHKEGFGPSLPHLKHSANASQVEIDLDNLQTKLGLESRYAVQLLFVDTDSGQGQVDQRRSLDDEHTPGVFTVSKILVLIQY
jgi:hypothetical protein